MKIIHVLIFLLLCGIAAVWAHSLKRRGLVWFLIAFFCTPLIAYIFLLAFSLKKATFSIKRTAEAATASLQNSALHKRIYTEQEDAFLEKALSELEESQPSKALWAKALVESDGNESQARAKYIKKRCEQLLLEEVGIRAEKTNIQARAEREETEKKRNEKVLSSQLYTRAHRLHYGQGKKERAKIHYTEILEKYPNSEDASFAQHQLDKLKLQEQYNKDESKT